MTVARVRPINGLPLAGPLDGSEIIPGTQGGAAVGLNLGKIADAAAQKVGFDPAAISALQTGKADKSALGTAAALNSATVAAPGVVPQFFNVDGSGIPGVGVTGQGLIFRHVNPTGQDVSTLRIDRLGYVGGQDGFENAALDVNNFVGAGAISYEDTARLRMESSANLNPGSSNGGGPQNVNLRLVTIKKGTAPVWQTATEYEDRTQVAKVAGTATSPTTAAIIQESILAANGPDANFQRVGIDLVTGRPFNDAHTGYVGDASTLGTGLRFVRQVADPVANRFGSAISLGSPFASTDFDRGLDMRYATFSTGGYAIAMATGQRMSFETGGGRTLDWTGGFLNYRVDTNPVFKVSDTGALTAGGLTLGNTQRLAFTADGSRNWNFDTGQMQYNVGGGAKFWLTDAGNIVSVGSSLRLASASTPASATAPGDPGTIQWDSNYIYVCVAANTWKRTALSTW